MKRNKIWEDQWYLGECGEEGVVLSGKTPEAAEKLSILCRDGQVENDYQAVIEGIFPEGEGELKLSGENGEAQVIDYEVLDELDLDKGTFSLILFQGEPGQEEAIRSFAERKRARVVEGGLFSSRITFNHPFTGEEIVLHREPEGKAFDMIDQMDW